MPNKLYKVSWRVWLPLVLGLIMFAALSGTALAGSPVDQENNKCLSCHKMPDLSISIGEGKEKLSLYVDPAKLATSVHSTRAQLKCVDCHEGIGDYPHPKKEFTSVRDYWQQSYEVCRKCHTDEYSKTIDSMHEQALQRGDPRAPVCTDCHGAHDTQNPVIPKQSISETCKKCHEGLYNQYANSVHGKALMDDHNQDVPVCTNCHGVHNIQDPRTAAFRSAEPDLCAKCHSNTALMEKYRLTRNAVYTYQQDFHGVTIDMYKTRWPGIYCPTAVCSDCHGIHDIRKASDAGSTVNHANLPQTCGKCHPGANASFTKAWTGHNQPSSENAPLTFWVQVFYILLIPLVVGALLVYIFFDVIRIALGKVLEVTRR